VATCECVEGLHVVFTYALNFGLVFYVRLLLKLEYLEPYVASNLNRLYS
jgi:hypothetical protein